MSARNIDEIIPVAELQVSVLQAVQSVTSEGLFASLQVSFVVPHDLT